MDGGPRPGSFLCVGQHRADPKRSPRDRGASSHCPRLQMGSLGPDKASGPGEAPSRAPARPEGPPRPPAPPLVAGF